MGIWRYRRKDGDEMVRRRNRRDSWTRERPLTPLEPPKIIAAVEYTEEQQRAMNGGLTDEELEAEQQFMRCGSWQSPLDCAWTALGYVTDWPKELKKNK